MIKALIDDPMTWPLPEVGVCCFCEEAPDGDRYSWIGGGRRRCSKVQCVIAFDQYYDRRIGLNKQRERRMSRLIAKARKAKKFERRAA